MANNDSLHVIRRDELVATIGLSVSQIYRLMSEGRFPRPIRLGKKSVGWRAGDVRDWLESRPAA